MPPANEAMATAALRELIESYHDLNPAAVEELDEEPSPLEFMRYVARNTPFVVRGGVRDWDAFGLWDRAFLEEAMGGMRVNVAVTPRGWVSMKCLRSQGLVEGGFPG